jgi:hypothetical protein
VSLTRVNGTIMACLYIYIYICKRNIIKKVQPSYTEIIQEIHLHNNGIYNYKQRRKYNLGIPRELEIN